MIFALIIHLFFIKCICKPKYAHSIFGKPGTDEVENEWVDGIEILEKNLPIPTRKHIKNANFIDGVIPDDCYPYSNHNLNLSYWELLRNETQAIRNFYNNRAELNQEDIYWHPAAPQNYFTTQEALDKADRVKIKFTVQPRYTRHILPAFIPPGEPVTFEISESVKKSVSITLNPQCKSFDGETPRNQQRLPNLQLTFPLNNAINTIGSPYGGSCSVHVNTADPIDIIVSGVILQPYFYYGMTSDDEWENDLSQRPGPFAYFDTGNLVLLAPSNQVRNSFRLNDCMKYWRSSVQISQTSALDFVNYGNSRYGRIHNPCIVYYDVFVPYGEACSYTTTNHIQAPPYWVPQSITFDTSVDNPWGITHEINHQHQYDWGKTQSSTEMTNNAINLITYARTNLASSSRPTGGWPRYTYASYMLNDQDNYGLSRYSTMLHFFGVDRMKKFIAADQMDLYYSKNVYGVAGSEMLKASVVLNRSMRYHWNFHHTSDEVLNEGTENTLEELEKLNLKPFHPVSTVYACGLVVDGNDEITARPYRLIPIEQTIDFVSTMVQRPDKEKFGDFEYHSAVFESGRESAWKEKSKGVFVMKPKENITEVEEVRVNYLDKTTNEIHTLICQFTSMYSYTGYAKYTRYGYIPNTENDIIKAYRYIAEHGNESNIISVAYTNNGIASPDYTNPNINTWISVLEGMIKPPSDGSYVFSATADLQALFYLSEDPLQGNPDLDADKLINYQTSTQMGFDNANKSKEMNLEADKFYYFRHVVYPNRGGDRKGRGWVGFKRNGEGNWDTVPKTWMRLYKITEEEMFKYQYVPSFQRIYEMDVWSGLEIIKNSQANWSVYKYPKGGTFTNSNNGQGTGVSLPVEKVLTDSDDFTEFKVNWWPSNVAVAYPHIFEIDMGEVQSFNMLKLKGSGNNNWFGMKTYFKIYTAPYNYSATTPSEIPYKSDNYSIDHEESLIWEGNFDTSKQTFIDFEEKINGRYLKLVFVNNSQNWKDGNPGRTDIAALEVGQKINNKKIYPMTNRRYITLTNRWDEYRGGAYYNGKGFTGYAAGAAPAKEGDTTNSANSIMSIRIPKLKPEFGIIGDFYPEMGTAIVKMDGVQVGIIGPNNQVDANDNARKLSKSRRAYKSVLFYTTELDTSKHHTCTVEVIEGQVTFAALLTHQMIVKYDTDDWRYPRILETEFDDDPEEYPWDITTDEFLHPAATPTPSFTPFPTKTPTATPTASQSPTPSKSPEPTNTPHPTYTPPNYADLTMAEATGDYAQSADYWKQQKIPTSSFLSYDYSGEKNDRPITNAFDDKKDTYWVSSKQNTDTFKNYLSITFTTPQCIEAILYDAAYSTKWNDQPRTRRYDGFPTILKVYIANGDEDFRLHAIFSGPPSDTDIWDRVIFAFPDPIWCDKIKVEFSEITLDVSFGSDYTVAAGNIIFVKSPNLIPTNSPFPTPNPTPLGYEELLMVEATGNYAQSSTSYVNNHLIPTSKFTYEYSGAKDGKPITNAFDMNKDSYWVSSEVNTEKFKNYLTLTFNSPQLIEAILLDPAYSTNHSANPKTRRYDGFPQVLKVYTSVENEELKLHSVFKGAPESTDLWDRVKFAFSTPVWCTKIKVEFDEVTLDVIFGNDYSIAVGNIIFISPQSLIPTPSPASTPEPTPPPSETPHATVIPLNYDNLTTVEAKGKYAQSSTHVDEYKVPITGINYESSSEDEQQPLSNVYDGNKNTYWIPSSPNTDTFENYIIANFAVDTNIEAILFDPTFTTNYTDEPPTRQYDGFPFVIKVYISLHGEEFRLHSVFNGGPQSTDFWDRVQLVFTKPIWCNKIKLEFSKVSINSAHGDLYLPSCSEITFISTVIIPAPTQTPLTYEELVMMEATGDYAQNAQYVNEHYVPNDRFTYEYSGGAKDGHPITYAFDLNKNTYWVSSEVNTDEFKNYIILTFTSKQCLESILFDSAYSTDHNANPKTRRYDGFPQVFKIYISNDDEEFKLHSIFRGAPTNTDIWDRVKLEFSTPVNCDKIKIEFDEVTLDVIFGNDYSVAVGNLIFISPYSFIQTPVATATPVATQTATPVATQTATPVATRTATPVATRTATPVATRTATPVATRTATPDPKPTATPVATHSMTPTPIETTPNEISIYDVNLDDDSRYSKVVETFEAITVNIKVTNFTKISYPDNGGAINVVNAGFQCSQTEFIECSSNEIGGAIHLTYEYDYKNSYLLNDLTFKKCSAKRGGAVYIYSASKRNAVKVTKCLFEGNIAAENNGKLSEGSAIFMAIKSGSIKSCTFIDNIGDSTMKVVTSLSTSGSKSMKMMPNLLLDQEDKLLIIDCEFESSKKTKNCLFYLLGNNGASSFEMRNCFFYGDLKDGEYYIDGKAESKNGPKLVLKKCKFAIDSKRAFNYNPSFISVDLNDQWFNYSDGLKEHKNINLWKIIVAAVVPAAAIAIIIFAVIFFTKRKNKNNNVVDECEMSAQSYIIPENDKEINAPLI